MQALDIIRKRKALENSVTAKIIEQAPRELPEVQRIQAELADVNEPQKDFEKLYKLQQEAECLLNENKTAEAQKVMDKVKDLIDKIHDVTPANEVKSSEEPLTKVVFKKFPEGDVIALFPDEIFDQQGNIASYMHVGQHGAASPALIQELEDASVDEYAPLKMELESLAPEPYRLQIVESTYVKATGEPDQDYDHEIFDRICEALAQLGYQCKHREFDKYQGVKMEIKKDGKLVDTLWSKDFYFSGPTKQNHQHKYRSAVLLDADGNTFSADRGDYFAHGPDHVFQDNILVMEPLQGEEIEIENPKVSDLPDGSEIARYVEFEGTPNDVLVLWGEKMGEDEDIHIMVTPEGQVDIEELAEYLLHASEMDAPAEAAAEPSADDLKDFEGFCRNASDAQVPNIYEKEKSAGRDEYAEVAHKEMVKRGLV